MVEKEMQGQTQGREENYLNFVKNIPPEVWKAALIERNSGGSGLSPLASYADTKGEEISQFKANLQSVMALTGDIWDRVLKAYQGAEEKPTGLAVREFVEKTYMQSHPEDYSQKVAQAVTALLKEYQAEHPAAQKSAEQKQAAQAPKAQAPAQREENASYKLDGFTLTTYNSRTSFEGTLAVTKKSDGFKINMPISFDRTMEQPGDKIVKFDPASVSAVAASLQKTLSESNISLSTTELNQLAKAVIAEYKKESSQVASR
ncbi:MAG: hypothetical protein WCT31_04225 [Candidatus Micrarchaeia archaeon]